MFFKTVNLDKVLDLMPEVEKPILNQGEQYGYTDEASCTGTCNATCSSFTCCGGTDCNPRSEAYLDAKISISKKM